jgi:hypothetical protein
MLRKLAWRLRMMLVVESSCIAACEPSRRSSGGCNSRRLLRQPSSYGWWRRRSCYTSYCLQLSKRILQVCLRLHCCCHCCCIRLGRVWLGSSRVLLGLWASRRQPWTCRCCLLLRCRRQRRLLLLLTLL